jgi:hypothetical protein
MLGIFEKLKRAMKLPGCHCIRKINSYLKDKSGSILPQDGGCGEQLNRFYSLWCRVSHSPVPTKPASFPFLTNVRQGTNLRL